MLSTNHQDNLARQQAAAACGVSGVFQQAAAMTAASLFAEALADSQIDVDKIDGVRQNSIELIETHGISGAFEMICNQSSSQSLAFW